MENRPKCMACGKELKRLYCSVKCRAQGSGNARWKGGKTHDGDGYIMKWIPPEERTNPSIRYVREHRWIMEKHLGRKLKRTEAIHHKDGDRTNNDIRNLVLRTFSEHSKFHVKKTMKSGKWIHPNPPLR